MAFSAIATAVNDRGDAHLACAGLEARISNISDLYSSLGLTPDRFQQWTLEFGADSLGKSDTGEILIPEFPVFSKIAWMDIDSVTIERFELPQLILESNLLIQKTESRRIQQEASGIRNVAECAMTHDLFLRFGVA